MTKFHCVCLTACMVVSPVILANEHTSATTAVDRSDDLGQTIDRLQERSTTLTPDRLRCLDRAANLITIRRRSNDTVTLAFICTHNSRRSHLAQVWATVAANAHHVQQLRCVSGGTEATACNPRIVESLRRAGFSVQRSASKTSNPKYQVGDHQGRIDLDLWSKRYSSAVATGSPFVAMLCCSDADERCPVIVGATARIPLHYDDPKIADDTDEETAVYDARRDQIGAEMFYLMRKIAELSSL